MELAFNKAISCLNCPDRSPSCHCDCEFYIYRSEKLAARKASMKVDKEYYTYKQHSIDRRRSLTKVGRRTNFIYKR